MGYDLQANNSDLKDFHFGAFSWPVLLEAFNYLFPSLCKDGQFYVVLGVDPRMPEGDQGARLSTNDGFLVTEEEAKIMARLTRNYVVVQRSLDDTHKTDTSGPMPFKEPWPCKIRDDWVDKFEKFADWAEKSGGFAIY